MLRWLVDLRPGAPLVQDQGPRGVCLSLAITGAHDAVAKSNLSSEYLHWNSANFPGGRGNPAAAIASLTADGQPPHSQWAFDATVDEFGNAYSPPASVVGPYARAKASDDMDLDGMVAAMVSGEWPVLCLNLPPEFFTSPGGLVLSRAPGIARHAVLGVGAAIYEGPLDLPGLRPGDRLICLRNSWGESWGRSGYALMSEAVLNVALESAFTIQPI
jgi:C1A family cysteine protease